MHWLRPIDSQNRKGFGEIQRNPYPPLRLRDCAYCDASASANADSGSGSKEGSPVHWPAPDQANHAGVECWSRHPERCPFHCDAADNQRD